jgi:hypothetical protein
MKQVRFTEILFRGSRNKRTDRRFLVFQRICCPDMLTIDISPLRSIIFVGLTILSVFFGLDSPKGFGQIPITGPETSCSTVFDLEMIKILEETGYKSATLAVTNNGKLVVARGYGWQDAKKSKPINPFTRMKIASIEKAFIKVAIKKLMADERIQPSTLVFEFLNIKPLNGQFADRRVYQITVQNLIDHKLGWDANHDGLSSKNERNVKMLFQTEEPTFDQLNSFMASQLLQHDPGSKSQYSNYGHTLLTRVVAKASQKPYLDYVKQICEEVNVEISPWLPPAHRGTEEIFYSPELPPHLDCFSISAPDLCKFFQHYWVNGKLRNSNGYIFKAHGSWPGTTSVLHQRPDGINFAVIFNERGKVDNGDVDKRIDAVVDRIVEWPDVDLFVEHNRTRAQVKRRSGNQAYLLVQPSIFGPMPFRIWTDSSGHRKIEARLVSAEKDRVQLEQRNGTKIEVPTKRLGRVDRNWVKPWIHRVRD